ncbi:MAG: Pre-rRNA-processing protein ipi3 [Bogoriella megaspora]|nr:MAG: Pre-rRNA-processing protein ipi3 [Bogoriella megaspora]
MLTESFIASTAGVNKTTVTGIPKDASIFVHEYQPLPAIRASFKKSVTPRNCLAASRSHIFAAQAEKATVHVYSREKGSQETLVPFPEKIRSLALAADGAVLILGTEGGRIFLWETCTGRQVATQAAHLQAVTTLAVDQYSSLLLSGSDDSNIHVWNASEILSFSNVGPNSQNASKMLLRTLSDHRAAITSIILGHSASLINIAISASRDETCIVWNHNTGHALRTVLLPSSSICLALDPADRAFYAGFEDGTVQLVRFHGEGTGSETSLHDQIHSRNAIKPSTKDRWEAQGQELGAAHCIDVSFDGTSILTGHEGGQIISWDVAQGTLSGTLADLNGPVTNLLIEEPAGFVNSSLPTYKIHAVTKPRFDLSITGQGSMPSGYTVNAQFTGNLHDKSIDSIASVSPSASALFDEALTHSTFPTALLDEGIAELEALRTKPTTNGHAAPEYDADFLLLDDSATKSTNGSVPTNLAYEQLELVNKDLQEQNSAQKRIMMEVFKKWEELKEEKKIWLADERERNLKKIEKGRRKRERIEKNRREGKEYEQVETSSDEEEGEEETTGKLKEAEEQNDGAIDIEIEDGAEKLG